MATIRFIFVSVMYYTAPPQTDNIKTSGNKKETLGTEAVLLSFVGRGVIIGERAMLTGQPGHKSFICATHTEVSTHYRV